MLPLQDRVAGELIAPSNAHSWSFRRVRKIQNGYFQWQGHTELTFFGVGDENAYTHIKFDNQKLSMDLETRLLLIKFAYESKHDQEKIGAFKNANPLFS